MYVAEVLYTQGFAEEDPPEWGVIRASEVPSEALAALARACAEEQVESVSLWTRRGTFDPKDPEACKAVTFLLGDRAGEVE